MEPPRSCVQGEKPTLDILKGTVDRLALRNFTRLKFR